MNVKRNFYSSYVCKNCFKCKILESLDKSHRSFEYLSPKNDLKDLHSELKQVFADQIADMIITDTMEMSKRVQITVFHDLTICRYKIRCGQLSKRKLFIKIIRRMKKSYLQVITNFNVACFTFLFVHFTKVTGFSCIKENM